MRCSRYGFVGHIFRIALGLFLISFPGAKADTVSGFAKTECWFGSSRDRKVSCGILRVPVDHFDPDGRFFELPVVRIHLTKGAKSKPPLIYLTGGPGMTSHIQTAQDVSHWMNFGAEILFRRELVVIEMRGSRASKPSMMCPALNDPTQLYGLTQTGSNAAAEPIKIEDLWKACRDDLARKGIDVASVNRHQIAHDIRVLAQGLGADKISLYGISYGTTYAMTIMEEFPELVADVVLDSVYPPEATSNIAHTLALRRTLNKYFSACQKSTECASRYPDLERRFFDGVKNLSNSPVDVTFSAGSDNSIVQSVVVDDELYLAALREAMSWHDMQGWIPAYINAVDDPEGFPFGWLIELYFKFGFYKDFSAGAHYSSFCYDLPADFDGCGIENEFERAEMESWGLPACNIWRGKRADRSERKKLISSIPALILVGELDAVTPPYQARMAAAGLENSFLFEFPTLGHDILSSSDCARQIVLDFLRDSRERPHRKCLDSVPELSFETFY
ncbi:alpha/beta hydrolase [Hoeflea prorocentri]|uniref:Alpha/beta fold hydrolase n=1 Tax=Hoeflea prorocentri TaxID=1922333 RepID=A0A9X3ZJR2_9HYPH|nr:alpha/beta fold hydrolase [Hoeflea prorocentri]MCY6383251.1 alpha/beta fold hydrolase [Hoeflea prorocentri]MDA5401051.1 alpha/beta fold hydrolase [Hoeflea prorocentri]